MKSPETTMSDSHVRDDTVQPLNRIATNRAERLRQAIKAAGGNNRVSERSGVPLGTLGYYLRGRDFQTETLVALAEACGVTVEWLATGQGSSAAPPAAAPAGPPALFSIVDMELLGSAIEGATAAFAARNAEPAGRAFAQIVCLLYDEARERMNKLNTPA